MPQKELDDFQGSVDHTDPDVLEQLYNEEGLSMAEMGDRFGVGTSTISYQMNKHNLEHRAVNEGIREAHRVEYANYHITSSGHCAWRSDWKGAHDLMYVHRLLAVAEYGFDAVCDMHVHHKNGIPWLNYPDNIELISHSDHARMHQHGESHSRSKLTREQAMEIKKERAVSDKTLRELADEYGVSGPTVSKIANGEAWRHLEGPE